MVTNCFAIEKNVLADETPQIFHTAKWSLHFGSGVVPEAATSHGVLLTLSASLRFSFAFSFEAMREAICIHIGQGGVAGSSEHVRVSNKLEIHLFNRRFDAHVGKWMSNTIISDLGVSQMCFVWIPGLLAFTVHVRDDDGGCDGVCG